MKNYFNEDQIEILKNKDISEKEIKEINETLKLYFKKVNKLNVDIDGQAICNLENIQEFMKERETYGIKHWAILRELVLKKLDSKYENGAKFKELFYSTIKAAAPDYMDMGGSQFYRVYVGEEGIRICGLDNLFHFIEVKDIAFSEIKGCCLKDKIKAEGQEVNIYYEGILLKENKYPMYMYFAKKDKERALEFHKIFLENGVEGREKLRPQCKNSLRIGKWIAYGFYIVIAIILIRLIIECFKVIK